MDSLKQTAISNLKKSLDMLFNEEQTPQPLQSDLTESKNLTSITKTLETYQSIDSDKAWLKLEKKIRTK